MHLNLLIRQLSRVLNTCPVLNNGWPHKLVQHCEPARLNEAQAQKIEKPGYILYFLRIVVSVPVAHHYDNLTHSH